MISDTMNNSDIQGYFTFNSEKYSINDLVGALLSQGISVHKIGTNLKVGQKIINPIANNLSNYSTKLEDPVNENVIQGLASQIQRIFNELNKLKDHLGINNSIMQELSASEKQLFDFSSYAPKSQKFEQFDMKKKWNGFIPNKNFDLNPENKLRTAKDTPIITLGRKKSPSLIEEYTDLVTNKGVLDNDALDSLSTKLFNTANRSHFNLDTKADLRASLLNQSNSKSSAATTEYTNNPFTKCDQCNSKIPNEAKFCSKCGNNIRSN